MIANYYLQISPYQMTIDKGLMIVNITKL